MKIAVPVRNENLINEHFGKSGYFNVYSVEESKILAVKTIPSFEGSGCRSGIAGILAEDGVTTVLVAGIGNGSLQKLKVSGIEVISGCAGSASENVELFLKGKLHDAGSSCNKHSDHHHHSDHKQVRSISGNDLRIKLKS
jgi:predicted Fe-Mo cluster-binding NifX family protein